MKSDERPEDPAPAGEGGEQQRKRDLRRALTFGVVMATVQLGILLYFMYC